MAHASRGPTLSAETAIVLFGAMLASAQVYTHPQSGPAVVAAAAVAAVLVKLIRR